MGCPMTQARFPGCALYLFYLVSSAIMNTEIYLLGIRVWRDALLQVDQQG